MTAPPHWLHVFATFGRGGPQVRTTQVMAALGAAVRHTVIAMDGRTEAAALVPEGVPLTVLPPPPEGGFLATRRAMAARLRELRPDLLLTYNWGAIETVAAARQIGLRAVVHHEEGFGPEEVTRRLFRRNLLRRWLLRGVAAVAVPSEVLRGIARAEWRVAADRLHCLPNGVDLERFRPAAAAPARAVVGTVGGLRAEKDHATLLRAIALLPAPRPVLRIVGDGPLGGELRRLAVDLGLERDLELPGATADPAAAYRSFTVFALSSRTEQMPLSLLEAMATGLPVVTTDVGDCRRMLPEACRGGVVPPLDPPALAGALAALLADPARRRREGQQNRAHCGEHFAAARCLERWIGLYRQAR